MRDSEKRKFLDGIWDYTASREVGFTKISALYAVLGTENSIRDGGNRSSGCGIVMNRELECGIKTPLPDPGDSTGKITYPLDPETLLPLAMLL